ncbi:MAG: hypothetical protein COA78_14365 [Blastopirellula sp.]|nr:MAG: hypothetical protein COA78_14365 [Blastopirellula sp.]
MKTATRKHQLFISLPAINRRVPLAAYVAAIRRAKANPDVEFKTGLSTWWPTTGRKIMRQFREGMNTRINDSTPYIKRGVAQ